MKGRYNLALVPCEKSKEIIELAERFSPFAHQYILGKHSLPHVTLSHFEWEEEKIAELWSKVHMGWQKESLFLKLETFSWTSSDQMTYWVALMPNMRDTLFNMHVLITELLMRPVREDYDPHLTLLNTTNLMCQREMDNISYSYVTISDFFHLVLGKSDEVGQLTEILFTHANSSLEGWAQ